LHLAFALVLLSGLATGLAGCADGDPEGGAAISQGPSRRGPMRPLPNVFISPAGEPFRALAGAPYPAATWFARANTSHDGRLTRAQFDADAMAFFRRLDENHDGVIDGLEVQDYEQKVAPEILPHIDDLRAGEGMDASLAFDPQADRENRENRKSSGLGDSRPLAPRGVGVQGAGVYSYLNTPEPVAAADASFDGRITAAEFQAAVDRRFDELDKTGRGYLTLDALPKTPVQQLIEKRAKELAKRRKAHRGGGGSGEPDRDAPNSGAPNSGASDSGASDSGASGPDGPAPDGAAPNRS
jgi:hypothetical protein